MSWGAGVRTGIAVGVGSLISFVAGYARDVVIGNLETEAGANLVQEDGGFILLE
jgi:peptidoglycan biosynthesis protein MviN/MurJ (putative lipid II flippase)